MRVLIVGAGAVGLTYGLHLQRGGAEVSFFVRPKYADAARKGFTLYPLNGSQGAIHLQGAGVVTTPDEVAAQSWDQIWLAVSSPALKGAWLSEVLQAGGSDCTVVLLTPGIDDTRLLLELVSEDRLVRGMISLIAYQAPLPGEDRFTDPGIAYWFPPMGPSPFMGGRAASVVSALRGGGQPATQVTDLSGQATIGSAVLMPLLLALEQAQWTWSVFASGDHIADATCGIRESITIACATAGISPPLMTRLITGPTIRVLLTLAPKILPLDIEIYLTYHFVKVGQQTRQHITRTIELGQERGLPTATLQRLLAAVPAIPGDARTAAAEVLATR